MYNDFLYICYNIFMVILEGHSIIVSKTMTYDVLHVRKLI